MLVIEHFDYRDDRGLRVRASRTTARCATRGCPVVGETIWGDTDWDRAVARLRGLDAGLIESIEGGVRSLRCSAHLPGVTPLAPRGQLPLFPEPPCGT